MRSHLLSVRTLFDAVVAICLCTAVANGEPHAASTSRPANQTSAQNSVDAATHLNEAISCITRHSDDSDIAKGLKILVTLDNEGATDATYQLAAYYANGEFVPRDLDRAEGLLDRAAGKGSKLAREQLDHLGQYRRTHSAFGHVGLIAYPTTNPTFTPEETHRQDMARFNAFLYRTEDRPTPEIIARLADWVATHTDDADAEYALAQMYLILDPKEHPNRVREAPKLLERAVNLGNDRALAELGLLKARGQGVPLDVAGGLAMVRTAMNHNCPEGFYSMSQLEWAGVGVPKNRVHSYEFNLKAMDLGMSRSVCDLAQAYLLNGYKEEAADRFTVAARNGDVRAIAELSALIGEQGDKPRAFQLMLRAAKHGGLIGAQEKVGEFYWYGTGTNEDRWEAVTWFRMGSDAGNLKARYYLAMAYAEGQGAVQDVSTGMAMLEKLDREGEPAATYALGACYASGNHVERDPNKARQLLEHAQREGVIAATKALDELEKETAPGK